ncbi:MAG: ABC transporter ATP-binding protein/permease [Clostridia bacterium]|nr:ABC transporter ATP-binding protein/permease [Clostridia bacterium]
MIKIMNMHKRYKTKSKVFVDALYGVDLEFGDKGMVFVIGKSGSGKSTLLNLIGGLDKYDSGDMRVLGKSTKSFSQSEFDSYRNTYVGFVFQDYNLLPEFTVGANIALAMELRGMKADNAKINEVMNEVGIADLANRKTNELSGGQMQRVAIARAIVKNPKIILADEPTGALDTVTGKQVLDTLKKLSADRLVLVVSHDVEYAYSYADRIIELKDGRVIKDVSRELGIATSSDMVSDSQGDTDAISDGLESANATSDDGVVESVLFPFVLTDEERMKICEYIRLVAGRKVKIDCITDASRLYNSSEQLFTDTNLNTVAISDTSEDFKSIKSKLPVKCAVRIGASALKYKKVKLIFTILLCVIAFTFFGFSFSVASYKAEVTATRSIVESGVEYATFSKVLKDESDFGGFFTYSRNLNMGNADIDFLEKTFGRDFNGVFCYIQNNLSLGKYFADSSKLYEGYMPLYVQNLSGFVKSNESGLASLGYSLSAGTYPKGRNEIALTEIACLSFIRAGYLDIDTEEGDKYVINNSADMVGKTLTLDGVGKVVISGIIDTGMDMSRYDVLYSEESDAEFLDFAATYFLYGELGSLLNYSYLSVAFVSEEFIETRINELIGTDVLSSQSGYYCYDGEGNVKFGSGSSYLIRVDSLSDVWNNGRNVTYADDIGVFKVNDIVVSTGLLQNGFYTEDEGLELNELSKLDCMLSGSAVIGKLENYYTINCRIVGVVENDLPLAVLTKDVYSLMGSFSSASDNIYTFAIGNMPDSSAEIRKMVDLHTNVNSPYELKNNIMYTIDNLGVLFEILKDVFVTLGIVFGIFALLLLSSFIGNSVVAKKKEIGVLRAIGARGTDVFNVFWAESVLIALMCFVLALVFTALFIGYINSAATEELGLEIQAVTLRFITVLGILGVSVFGATIACLLPVIKIARKRPIDAIRNK